MEITDSEIRSENVLHAADYVYGQLMTALTTAADLDEEMRRQVFIDTIETISCITSHKQVPILDALVPALARFHHLRPAEMSSKMDEFLESVEPWLADWEMDYMDGVAEFSKALPPTWCYTGSGEQDLAKFYAYLMSCKL